MEVKPWVRAFWAERALPAFVRGPVECWALRLFLVARSVVSCSWSVVVLSLRVREVAVDFGIALGAVELGVAFLVELLVFAQVAELIQDGVEAGLEAVVEGLDSC